VRERRAGCEGAEQTRGGLLGFSVEALDGGIGTPSAARSNLIGSLSAERKTSRSASAGECAQLPRSEFRVEDLPTFDCSLNPS
jgi:hypothetical protein